MAKSNGKVEEKSKRKHKATYSTDRIAGGYLIRVAGPNANAFIGQVVPVNTKAGEEHQEKLTKLVWAGKDKESGENVALYRFEAKPRVESETVDF